MGHSTRLSAANFFDLDLELLISPPSSPLSFTPLDKTKPGDHHEHQDPQERRRAHRLGLAHGPQAPDLAAARGCALSPPDGSAGGGEGRGGERGGGGSGARCRCCRCCSSSPGVSYLRSCSCAAAAAGDTHEGDRCSHRAAAAAAAAAAAGRAAAARAAAAAARGGRRSSSGSSSSSVFSLPSAAVPADTGAASGTASSNDDADFAAAGVARRGPLRPRPPRQNRRGLSRPARTHLLIGSALLPGPLGLARAAWHARVGAPEGQAGIERCHRRRRRTRRERGEGSGRLARGLVLHVPRSQGGRPRAPPDL